MANYRSSFKGNEIDAALAAVPNKVDKEVGKGLSEANFTNAEKTKLSTAAPLASPAFTGVPTAPTAAVDTNNTQVANTAFVQQEIQQVVDGLAEADSPTLVGGISVANIQKDFATVSQMVAFSGFEVGMKCRTYAYNTPVVTDWEIVASGAGDLTDRTLSVAGGLYAKIIKGIHNVLSYGAYGNDVNDDRQFFQTAITATGGAIIVPVPAVKYFMTPGLDLTNCTVQGGSKLSCIIRFSSAQQDCVVSAGNTVIRDMYLDGGWDGATPAQTGDLIRVNSTTFIGEFHASNLILRNAKQDAIRLSNLGYSSLTDVQSNATGRIGLHLDGEGTPAKTVTTIKLYGKNRFSDCPNGFGLRVYDGHNCDFTGLICEYTAGIEIAGNNNRSLNFDSVYQEFGSGSNAYTFTGSGVGLTIVNNFGGGKAIPNTANFFDVTIFGNSNFSSISPIQVNDLLQAICPETATPMVTGVQNTTAATINNVPSGLYRVFVSVQTVDAGSANLLSCAAYLTTGNTDSAYQTSTSNFQSLADSRFSSGSSNRLQIQGFLSLGSTSNVYLRFGYNLAAGQIAYAGRINLERVK